MERMRISDMLASWLPFLHQQRAQINPYIAGFPMNSAQFKWIFAALAALLGSAAWAASPPRRYAALQGMSLRAHSAAPEPGPAGAMFFDPDFGTELARVTDARTDRSMPGRSYATDASSETNAWNADSTRFFIIGAGGSYLGYRFDKVGLAATPEGRLPLASVSFSFADPDVIYGRQGRRVRAYRFSNRKLETIVDLAEVVPGDWRYVGTATASADDSRLAVYFGGKAQDRSPYVLVWERRGARRRLLDTAGSTIDGRPVEPPVSGFVHNARIDLSGRFVVITKAGGGLLVWDLESDAVYPAPSATGHKAAGYGVMVNAAPGPRDYGPQIRKRGLAQGEIAKPADLLPRHSSRWFSPGTHLSWNNARPDYEAPVLVSCYRNKVAASQKDQPVRELEGEIFAVDTSGSQAVWRIASHRSDYYQRGGRGFWDTPRGNVDPSGRFFLFTSHWERSLGEDPSAPDRSRHDVFVVRLPTIALEAAPSPSGAAISYSLPDGPQACTFLFSERADFGRDAATLPAPLSARGRVEFRGRPDTLYYGRAQCGESDVKHFRFRTLAGPAQ
jgi:hypothetical protein